MKTIEIKLYKFNELSEEAKQKAIERNAYINVEHDWWMFTYEDAANIGLKITGFDLDRNRHATGDFLYSAAEVAANILKEHGEHCETYKTAEKFLDEHNPIFAEYMDESSEHYESYDKEQELMEIEESFLSSLLEDYSMMLQDECEYFQSEEAIIETIEANEYDFTEDGKIY
jgi:hypothetical protein